MRILNLIIKNCKKNKSRQKARVKPRPYVLVRRHVTNKKQSVFSRMIFDKQNITVFLMGHIDEYVLFKYNTVFIHNSSEAQQLF